MQGLCSAPLRDVTLEGYFLDVACLDQKQNGITGADWTLVLLMPEDEYLREMRHTSHVCACVCREGFAPLLPLLLNRSVRNTTTAESVPLVPGRGAEFR